jgi:hypothetical protein
MVLQSWPKYTFGIRKFGIFPRLLINSAEKSFEEPSAEESFKEPYWARSHNS